MLKSAIKKVIEKHNLTTEEAKIAMDVIMRGEATPSQLAALITALRMKGETIEEITGFATAMREHAVKIYPHRKDLIDTCGTGGDSSYTFNISTISAIVSAGAGVAIAKHGNRAVSSKCGSADLLENLGVKIDIDPKRVEQCIDEVGFGFIFAPNFHKAMRFAGPTRKEIGIRTIFNILGPLTNPANAKAQVLGVFSLDLTEIISKVLNNLGVSDALVVYGVDGIDEISISEKTKVSHLSCGKINTYFIQPEDFHISRSLRESIVTSNILESVEIAVKILKNEEKGAKRDVVLLNAGAAICIAKLADNIKDGMEKAKESIESGKAYKKLEELIAFTNG